ncbi:MAG: putative arginyl-tRNA--protein transferase [Alphaproteobacteria bacterium MarineAlpha2_Bin1]|nr:MAG: putative arginyl-tRNA--protein transferase [Alphaproteobacteria bacterium MarineAlpha2_Bin1]|tara:strand:- start:820 stop:1539 length:720 start_codon:yes stop_codon:yes gene_type:complete
MNENPFLLNLKFYRTPETKCPYLPDKVEQLIFTHLDDIQPDLTHNFFAKSGYRRSHGIVYKPDCKNCSECIPVRINASKFQNSKKYRRILMKNSDIYSNAVKLQGTDEQYKLFNKYQNSRHKDGNMSLMQIDDYKSMIEESPVETSLIEYRKSNGKLFAVSLTDKLFDGYSMVYSFFDYKEKNRSPGNFMILDHINRAKKNCLSFIYLGYYIKNCNKMSYKDKFQPIEAFYNQNWEKLK